MALNLYLAITKKMYQEFTNKEKKRTQETLTLSTCADNSVMSKNKQNVWVQFRTPPVFKALRGDD